MQIHPNLWVFGWHQIASRSNHFEPQPNLLLLKIWKFCWTFQEPLNDCSSSFTVTSQPMWGPKKGAKHAWTTATQERKNQVIGISLGIFCDKIVPGGPECFFQSALGHAPASSCYCMCGMRWHYCSAPYGPERCELWRLIKSKDWEMSKNMRATWNRKIFHIYIYIWYTHSQETMMCRQRCK